MAKKKSTVPGVPSNGDPSAAAGRKRGARKGVVSADQSPVTGVTPTTSEEVQLAVAHDASSATGARQPSYQEIAEAAYQRYLSRGGVDGQDFDDWLAAERDLVAQQTR
jgi:hypothetical protein